MVKWFDWGPREDLKDDGVQDPIILICLELDSVQKMIERVPHLLCTEGENGRTLVIPLKSNVPIFENHLLAITVRGDKIYIHTATYQEPKSCGYLADELLSQIHSKTSLPNEYRKEAADFYHSVLNQCITFQKGYPDFCYEVDERVTFPQLPDRPLF